MFSVSGGRPWSVLENGISWSLMKEFGGRDDLSFLMLSGVFTKVMV